MAKTVPISHAERQGTFSPDARYLRGLIGRKKCEWDMSKTYIIEVGSVSAGIVVRDRAGFRFFSASRPFSSLDGKLFRSARDAERAAMKCAQLREAQAA